MRLLTGCTSAQKRCYGRDSSDAYCIRYVGTRSLTIWEVDAFDSIANHEKDEWINGEKASDIVAYLDRLYNAKKMIEDRIAALGGAADDLVSHLVLSRLKCSFSDCPLAPTTYSRTRC